MKGAGRMQYCTVIGNSKLIDLILIFNHKATVALRSSGIPNRQSFTSIDITFRYIHVSFRLCISLCIKNETTARLATAELSYVLFFYILHSYTRVNT